MTITFKAALTKIDKYELAIVWLDKKFIDQPEELKKYITFYKDLFKLENVALMMLDEIEEPHYFGKKDIVEILKSSLWKQFPWQEFSLEKG